jgi:hypothetical protein
MHCVARQFQDGDVAARFSRRFSFSISSYVIIIIIDPMVFKMYLFGSFIFLVFGLTVRTVVPFSTIKEVVHISFFFV